MRKRNNKKKKRRIISLKKEKDTKLKRKKEGEEEKEEENIEEHFRSLLSKTCFIRCKSDHAETLHIHADVHKRVSLSLRIYSGSRIRRRE